MHDSEKFQSRKKFLLWGAAALSSVSVLRFFKAPKKQKTETVKMLTQDGKLVEVTVSAIPSKKKKITNKELQNWIKKDKV
jgi:protein-disulfide isomerase